MIATEDEWEVAVGAGLVHEACHVRAGRLDRVEEPHLLVPLGHRFRHRSRDVAQIHDLSSEVGKTAVETRVADRRRAHVHATAILPEVERRADDRNGL
jgi:hypothetical protein